MKKYHIIISVLLIFAGASYSAAFAEGEKAESLEIDLIHPQKSNAPQRVLNVSTEAVVVSGMAPVTISKKPNPKDAEMDRYLVEYFIDDMLVYETNGVAEGLANSSFNWVLDTTKYKNGKHKLVVNYWDSKGPSAIGIKDFIIDNPVSIEDLMTD